MSVFILQINNIKVVEEAKLQFLFYLQAHIIYNDFRQQNR